LFSLIIDKLGENRLNLIGQRPVGWHFDPRQSIRLNRLRDHRSNIGALHRLLIENGEFDCAVATKAVLIERAEYCNVI
jgi:hypothetical protein